MSTTGDLIKAGGEALPYLAASPAVIKALELLRDTVGVLYKPRAMRNEADSKAYEIEMQAEANARALIISANAQSEVNRGLEVSRLHEERRQRRALEDTMERTIKYLPDTVASEPVDEDWAIRYFNIVKDVSADELKEVWAKVLAGELVKPGAISLRTMEAIRNLSKEEAQLFMKISTMSFNDSAVMLHFPINMDMSEFGIKYMDLLQLEEAGLLSIQPNMSAVFSGDLLKLNNANEWYFDLNFGKKEMQVILPPGILEVRIKILTFTNTGREIYSISDKNHDEKFLQASISFLKANYNVKINLLN